MDLEVSEKLLRGGQWKLMGASRLLLSNMTMDGSSGMSEAELEPCTAGLCVRCWCVCIGKESAVP